ncbi:MAG TPA: metalloregulator ArsR/SmtB family transcription factor [Luteolibacter sp.]|nr:metalloregulator ArsR/SmtB family transcription factor [Luteolibacter sp.]
MPLAKLEAFDQNAVELAGFARALSHPARIRILSHLARHRELPCMDIVAALPLSQPACSRHINELRKAGLLKSRTKGSNVFFRADPAALARFCKGMNHTLHPDKVS